MARSATTESLSRDDWKQSVLVGGAGCNFKRHPGIVIPWATFWRCIGIDCSLFVNETSWRLPVVGINAHPFLLANSFAELRGLVVENSAEVSCRMQSPRSGEPRFHVTLCTWRLFTGVRNTDEYIRDLVDAKGHSSKLSVSGRYRHAHRGGPRSASLLPGPLRYGCSHSVSASMGE